MQEGDRIIFTFNFWSKRAMCPYQNLMYRSEMDRVRFEANKNVSKQDESALAKYNQQRLAQYNHNTNSSNTNALAQYKPAVSALARYNQQQLAQNKPAVVKSKAKSIKRKKRKKIQDPMSSVNDTIAKFSRKEVEYPSVPRSHKVVIGMGLIAVCIEEEGEEIEMKPASVRSWLDSIWNA
eukprot:437596_1